MRSIFPRSRLARRFAGDARGVSAVEFALVLPLMMTLYLGGTEVSQAIAASRKATLVSRTVADLASQVSSISSSEMTNILNASSAIVSPFSPDKLKVTVSCVTIDANGKATISWSQTLNGTVHGTGSSVTLPAALAVPNTSLIWGEAQYDYTPAIGYVLTGTLTLKDQIYMRPRLSDTVTYPS
ncbi:MAG: TadE/TadG family type IV pilus assembly protein [Xanthobacteraceae bacterium]